MTCTSIQHLPIRRKGVSNQHADRLILAGVKKGVYRKRSVNEIIIFAPRIGRSSRWQFFQMTLMAEPGLTHCEMGNLNAICEHCKLPKLVRDWLQRETQNYNRAANQNGPFGKRQSRLKGGFSFGGMASFGQSAACLARSSSLA